MNLSTILAIYGNPQDSFKYIHVSGTNGKGSVCAYLASAIQELSLIHIFVLVSDGVVHAGVGQTYSFGWTRNRAAQFVRDMCCANERMSGPRLCALVSQQCNDLYNQTPGDDTTVAVAKIIEQKTVNIFTGPPCSYDDDEILSLIHI